MKTAKESPILRLVHRIGRLFVADPVVLGLEGDETSEVAFGLLHEFFVCAFLKNSALLNNDQSIRIAQGRKAVCDGDGSAAFY